MSRKIGKLRIFAVLIIIVLGTIPACRNRNGWHPASPNSSLNDMVNYAQMSGGSTVVNVNGEEHQLNFVLSAWGAYPYEHWIYAEINEQHGSGKTPGTDQIPVTLQQ